MHDRGVTVMIDAASLGSHKHAAQRLLACAQEPRHCFAHPHEPWPFLRHHMTPAWRWNVKNKVALLPSSLHMSCFALCLDVLLRDHTHELRLGLSTAHLHSNSLAHVSSSWPSAEIWQDTYLSHACLAWPLAVARPKALTTVALLLLPLLLPIMAGFGRDEGPQLYTLAPPLRALLRLLLASLMSSALTCLALQELCCLYRIELRRCPWQRNLRWLQTLCYLEEW